MACADEIHEVRPGLFFWQAYEPAVKVDLSSCALRAANGLILIDPIPLGRSAMDDLLAVGSPQAIVLTSGNHARAAANFRERFSIPILAHSEAGPELDVTVDRWVADDETIFEEWNVIALPGAAPGEIALHGRGALHLGDALVHLPPLGLSILPEKYCTNARELGGSLGKLLRISIEVLTFAHGLPIVARAQQRLSQLLA